MVERATDVAIVGAGMIGLAIAWRVAQRGLRVQVFDPAPGRGASHVAAGMLAPVSEVTYGEEPQLRLNQAGARRWVSFAEEVAEASGQPSGYHPTATLLVAYDSDDAAVLHDLGDYQRSLGLDPTPLTGREARRLEPLLAPGVHGGLYAAGDHAVDNRVAVAATLAAAERAGARVVRGAVHALWVDHDRVQGVDLADGTRVPAEQVVLAAGAWSAQLAGVPAQARPPVRPVKGELLRLRVPDAYPARIEHTIRATARGTPIYLTPRLDGEIVVGATTAELGFDTTVSAGGVYELLRDARAVVPIVSEFCLTETLAGLRPGTPDNAPILGPTPLPGLLLATGHYRHGIVLAPLTADALADVLTGGTLPDSVARYTLDRFTSGRFDGELQEASR